MVFVSICSVLSYVEGTMNMTYLYHSPATELASAEKTRINVWNNRTSMHRQ